MKADMVSGDMNRIGLPMRRPKFSTKMSNQLRNVVRPLSQRWQLNGKYVQAVIQNHSGILLSQPSRSNLDV